MKDNRTKGARLLWALCLFFFAAHARGIAQPPDSMQLPGLRISLLTCGVGGELYSCFGHTGVRIVDSVAGTDEVYNYGTFHAFEDNFILKFASGRLLYYLDKESLGSFLSTYVAEGRRVDEQVLLIDATKARKMHEALEENLLPQNRAYKYDFVYDNCATRVRDLFNRSLGVDFAFPKQSNATDGRSFRDAINTYLASSPWAGFGINLLLGMPVDKEMDAQSAMFLPDFLEAGLAKASFRGAAAAGPIDERLPQVYQPRVPAVNPVLLLTVSLAGLTLAVLLFSKSLRVRRRIINFWLIVTGLLGVFMLLMWFATDHDACAGNWNILWAIPTNLVAAMTSMRKRNRYAIVAMLLTLCVPVLHLLGVQAFPLSELWPLLLMMMVVYGMIFRLSNNFATQPNA